MKEKWNSDRCDNCPLVNECWLLKCGTFWHCSIYKDVKEEMFSKPTNNVETRVEFEADASEDTYKEKQV